MGREDREGCPFGLQDDGNCRHSWYLDSIIKKNAPLGLILSVSAIIAGAAGNLIDSAFYGMIFSESWHTPAVMFPEGGGYSSFLHGKVVDMLYFPY
jgi:signal peptidase II